MKKDTKVNEQLSPITSESDITVSLSTRSAVRLFKGRDKTTKNRAIIGLLGFSKIVRFIETAIKADDPWADYYYKLVEDNIDEVNEDLASAHVDICNYIETNKPKGLNLPNSVNNNPSVLPMKFASRLAFKMVTLILKADEIALEVLRANHVGMLPSEEKAKIINLNERKIRGVMHKAFEYKHTGVTRDDVMANNQRAIKAITAMGELDAEYYEGTLRSSNAPGLPRRRLDTLSPSKEEQDNVVSSVLDKMFEAQEETA